MKGELSLIPPDLLRPHEKINPLRAVFLLIKISVGGKFITPLLVDAQSKTILDGHHRHWVAKKLGLKKVPCWSVDYFNDQTIFVFPRRTSIPVDKSKIVERAVAGNKYPHKTTRHEYVIPVAQLFTLSELREDE